MQYRRITWHDTTKNQAWHLSQAAKELWTRLPRVAEFGEMETKTKNF